MSDAKKILKSVIGLAALAGCSSISASESSDVEFLRMALDDEYRAEAAYGAVMEAHGEVRPFVNIIEAERRHANRVKRELDRLGQSYDSVNPHLGRIAAPASLLAACEQAVEAELENIALYDRILPKIEDEAARATLSDLQRASRERHLPAFERCVARGGTMGRGRGQRRNNGH